MSITNCLYRVCATQGSNPEQQIPEAKEQIPKKPVFNETDFIEAKRPNAPETPEGEKVTGALAPSYLIFAPRQNLDEQSKEIIIKHNYKCFYVHISQKFHSDQATQFTWRIDKNNPLIAVAILLRNNSDLQEQNPGCAIVMHKGIEYIKINPTTNLKEDVDKQVADAEERNDGHNVASCTDADDFYEIKIMIQGTFILQTVFSKKILPSLSVKNNKNEKFMIGITTINSNNTSISIESSHTFCGDISDVFSDVISTENRPVYLLESNNVHNIINIGPFTALAILERPVIKVSHSGAVQKYGKPFKLANEAYNLASINLVLPDRTTANEPGENYDLFFLIDASASMYTYIDPRNNTVKSMLGIIEKTIKDYCNKGLIKDTDTITLHIISFDDRIIDTHSVIFKFNDKVDISTKFADIKAVVNSITARGGTGFDKPLELTIKSKIKSVCFITDGYHNTCTTEELLGIVEASVKNADIAHFMFLGVSSAYVPTLHDMKDIVEKYGHSADVFAGSDWPQANDTDYQNLASDLLSVLFQQKKHVITIPDSKIVMTNINKSPIDQETQSIHITTSQDSCTVIVAIPVDHSTISIEVDGIECKYDVKQSDDDDILEFARYLTQSNMYADSSNSNTQNKINTINMFLIENNILSSRISFMLKWFQLFSGNVTKKVETNDDVQKQKPMNIPQDDKFTNLRKKVQQLNQTMASYSYPYRSNITRATTRGIKRGNEDDNEGGTTRGLHFSPQQTISLRSPDGDYFLQLLDFNMFMNIIRSRQPIKPEMEKWFWKHILTLIQTNNIGQEVYDYFENTSFIEILNTNIEINKMIQKISIINATYVEINYKIAIKNINKEHKEHKDIIEAYQDCYNDIQTTYTKIRFVNNSEHILFCAIINESIKLLHESIKTIEFKQLNL